MKSFEFATLVTDQDGKSCAFFSHLSGAYKYIDTPAMQALAELMFNDGWWIGGVEVQPDFKRFYLQREVTKENIVEE